MKTVRLLFAISLLGGAPAIAVAQDPLGQAKSLYDAASYTEALSALDGVGNTADVAEIEKYRALCFLALGRPKDAEVSLEHLALSRPMFTLEGTDASPKLVALFQDVRKRTLPEAAKQTYQRARTSYDHGDIAEASRQFKEVIALADAAPPEYAQLMSELKMLATGFVRLTDAATPTPKAEAPVQAVAPPPQVVAAPATVPSAASRSANTAVKNATAKPAPPPAARPAPTPAVTETASPIIQPTSSNLGTIVYDGGTQAVKPPTAIERSIPGWQRPVSLRGFAFQGSLEVIIDEQGSVIGATMIKPIHAGFDPILLNAAKKWRFQPATLEGHPVKYRITYPITVAPM